MNSSRVISFIMTTLVPMSISANLNIAQQINHGIGDLSALPAVGNIYITKKRNSRAGLRPK